MSSYQVKLPVFEGPFDLLFHLIEEQKVNIYDIPIAAVTAQYLDYLHIMEILDMEVASGFLVMAATLLEIKSRMLLPREQTPNIEAGDEEFDGFQKDPDARAELVEKLLEYRQFKLMAHQFRELEKQASRIYTRSIDFSVHPEEILRINIGVLDLLNLYQGLVKRRLNPPIQRVIIDRIGVVERISEIRALLKTFRKEVNFKNLLKDNKNRYDLILSFLAVLELSKLGEIEISQRDNFKPIMIRSVDVGNVEERLSAVG